MSHLKFTSQGHWTALERHLAGGRGERFGFAHTRLLATTNADPILEVVGVELIDDVEVDQDDTGWFINDRRLDRVHNCAVTGGYGLVEFHSHRLGPPGFSPTDESAVVPMARYVTDLFPDRTYGAAVYAEGQVYGEFWIHTEKGLERERFRSVTVYGDQLRILNALSNIDSDRLQRQAPLLGDHGRQTLGALRIALVGAGGTGSHMALGLAFLGVPEVIVLDNDTVELSNLNRLITAGIADVGAPKSLVARRRMRETAPTMKVTTMPALTPDGDHPELEAADIIIGCVDHDGPRDRLNQIAVDTQTPYIDVATGVDAPTSPPNVGGRVVVVIPNGPCLHCLNELDPEEVGRWAKDAQGQVLDRQHGYGTAESNPSVVHLNGTAVHVAIAEVIAWIGGWRKPAQYLDVDLSGHLARSDSPSGTRVAPRRPVKPRPGCIGCASRQR